MADFTDEKTNKKSEALRDSVSGLQVPVPGERILSPSYLSLLQCVHLKKRTCMLPAAHTQLGLALVLAMSFLPPDLPSALATCLCPGLTWKDHIDGQPWQVTGRDGAGQRTANRLLPFPLHQQAQVMAGMPHTPLVSSKAGDGSINTCPIFKFYFPGHPRFIIHA